jgi:hypothetical protein
LLNQEFTVEEVLSGISALKLGKAVAGPLAVDLLKSVAAEVAPCLTALFNAVARQKQMPRDMAIGHITMALKPRAATTELTDHRTITVCTVLDKLYSMCLTARLSSWGESEGLRADTQTGFRRSHATHDNVLVLRALTERYQYDGQVLYCAFIDFKKAYDLVPRHKLWAKLRARGINGFFLDALQAQYSEVPLCVKTPEGLTAPFMCTMGLKQGEPSSPDLFGFYVDDLPAAILAIDGDGAFPLLGGQEVPPLLHADDVALASTSIQGLQAQLNKLAEYALTWDLQISLVKTKIMQLSGANSSISQRPSLVVNDTPLPWVSEFTYLGVPFHESEDLDEKMAAERLLKGRRAQAALRYRCSQLGITVPAMKSYLFDIIVKSTLGYGIELWGPGYLLKPDAVSGTDAAEKLHREFLRKILGVHSRVRNLVVYSEFGRYPLRCSWQRTVYAFWRRVMRLATGGSRVMLAAAVKDNMQLAAAQRVAGTPVERQSWAGKMVALLEKYGVTTDLTAGPSVPTTFESEIEGSAREEHLLAIRGDTGTRMTTYRSTIRGWADAASVTASAYKMQPYLNHLMPPRRRVAMARLHTSCHDLRVEVERHQAIHPPRDSRTCRLCNSGAVEDEHHMIFDCAYAPLVELRESYNSLFELTGEKCVVDFLNQAPRGVASFIFECFQVGGYESLPRPQRQRQRAAVLQNGATEGLLRRSLRLAGVST